MSPKVSIIIPIYNAHNWIGKCLDHLLAQTLKDIEIICVLDCPTDGTDKVVETYAEKDDRIIIIKNETNQHIGQTRNIGVKHAKGEYIGFSDHDDYCESNMYESLYNIAKEKDYSFVVCKHDCILPQQNKTTYKESTEKSVERTLKQLLQSTSVCSEQLIWNCIYKKDFLEKNNITFIDTKNISGEDTIFNIEVLLRLQNKGLQYGYTKETFYHHQFHELNTGSGKTYLDNMIKQRNYISKSFLNNNLTTHLHDINIGNIATSYRLLRNWLLAGEYKNAINVFRLFKQQDYLKEILRQEFRIWDKELTLPKNLFKWICRLYI